MSVILANAGGISFLTLYQEPDMLQPVKHSQAVKLISNRAFGKPDADAGPRDVIGYLLKSLSHLVRQALDENFRRQGLRVSFAHIPVLYIAKHEPGTPGAQLARRLSITAQSMNAILKRLERQGYIERKPHPHNRRAECWYVTRPGFDQLDLARDAGRLVWDRMLRLLTDAETTQLGELLQRCVRGLDEERGALPVREPAPRRERARGSDRVRRVRRSQTGSSAGR
jgi:DNA-binding MarR family transcriptional regulator